MNISELPEPYKSLAIKRRAEYDIKNNEDDLTSAISWLKTKEGYKFWLQLYLAKHSRDLPLYPYLLHSLGPDTITHSTNLFKFC